MIGANLTPLVVTTMALPFLLLGCPSTTAHHVESTVGTTDIEAEFGEPEFVEVSLSIPEAVEAPIEVTYSNLVVVDGVVTLRAARAAVGSYAPSPFSSFFRSFRATGPSGRHLPVQEVETGLYQVIAGDVPRINISYQVDAARSERELEDFTVSTHRRAGYTMLSGYATFVMVDGTEDSRHRVRLTIPEGWRVAWSHTLDEQGRFVAPTGFSLLDEPAMMGSRFFSSPITGAEDQRPSAWVHVYMEVIHTDPPPQLAALVEATEGALASVSALDLPRLDRPYHVMFEYLPTGIDRELGWALEHGSSLQGADFSDRHLEPSSLLTYHVAHHMLHAWLPRRLSTDRLSPQRQLWGERTDFVWFAEGFAQYLTYVGMARAGLADAETLLAMLGRRFVRPFVYRAPAVPPPMVALSRTLAGGEHDHWFFGFAQGGLLALWLDQQLIAEGRGTLDDAIRALFDRMSTHPDGIPEDEFERVFLEVTGLDVTELFARHVRGAEPLPLSTILAGAGIEQRDDTFIVTPHDELTDEGVQGFREQALSARPSSQR